MNVNQYCTRCGKRVFSGRCVDYEYPAGSENWKQDIEGEWEKGAGECESCGRAFCAEHKDFEDGLCPACREDQTDDLPF